MEYDNGRKKKGEEIAKSGKLRKEGEHWVVPSQSGHGNYVVSFATKEPICTCPDSENRHKIFHHQGLVLAFPLSGSAPQHCQRGHSAWNRKVSLLHSGLYCRISNPGNT